MVSPCVAVVLIVVSPCAAVVLIVTVCVCSVAACLVFCRMCSEFSEVFNLCTFVMVKISELNVEQLQGIACWWFCCVPCLAFGTPSWKSNKASRLTSDSYCASFFVSLLCRRARVDFVLIWFSACYWLFKWSGCFLSFCPCGRYAALLAADYVMIILAKKDLCLP